MTAKGTKHQIGEVMQRVETIAQYIVMNEKDLEELMRVRKSPDRARDILSRNAVESWIPNILGSYDAVVMALTEEVLSKHKPMTKQKQLREMDLKPKREVTFKIEKKVSVKKSNKQKAYSKSQQGKYENKGKVKAFVKSRLSMNNKQLTKEYNQWAMQEGYKLRTKSAVTTLKSRIKRDKWGS